jgi:predicted RNA-binding Zn-ribbon protein involved in translation (DUF1610 family)
MSNPNPQLPATCATCNHEVLEHKRGERVHTHCGSLGYELICDCPTCHGTGKALVCPDCHGEKKVLGEMPPGSTIGDLLDPRSYVDCPTCQSPLAEVSIGSRGFHCPDQFHKAAEAHVGGTDVPNTPPAEAPKPTPPESTLAKRIAEAWEAEWNEAGSYWSMDGWNISAQITAMEALIRSESQRAVEAFAEGLLDNKHYMGDPIYDPDKKHTYPYVWVNDVIKALEDYRNAK